MCLCREFNKRYSSNGLYHGRTVQSTKANYTKVVSPQVMVKKNTNDVYEIREKIVVSKKNKNKEWSNKKGTG